MDKLRFVSQSDSVQNRCVAAFAQITHIFDEIWYAWRLHFWFWHSALEYLWYAWFQVQVPSLYVTETLKINVLWKFFSMANAFKGAEVVQNWLSKVEEPNFHTKRHFMLLYHNSHYKKVPIKNSELSLIIFWTEDSEKSATWKEPFRRSHCHRGNRQQSCHPVLQEP